MTPEWHRPTRHSLVGDFRGDLIQVNGCLATISGASEASQVVVKKLA